MSVFAFVGQETAVERYLYQKRKQRWSGVEGERSETWTAYSENWRLVWKTLWIKCAVFGENALLISSVVIFFFQKTNMIWCRVSLTLSVLNLKLHLSELTKALDSLLDPVSIPSGSHHTLPNIPALYSSFQWRQTPMIPGAFSAPSTPCWNIIIPTSPGPKPPGFTYILLGSQSACLTALPDERHLKGQGP